LARRVGAGFIELGARMPRREVGNPVPTRWTTTAGQTRTGLSLADELAQGALQAALHFATFVTRVGSAHGRSGECNADRIEGRLGAPLLRNRCGAFGKTGGWGSLPLGVLKLRGSRRSPQPSGSLIPYFAIL
jgi:hypothetical protein